MVKILCTAVHIPTAVLFCRCLQRCCSVVSLSMVQLRLLSAVLPKLTATDDFATVAIETACVLLMGHALRSSARNTPAAGALTVAETTELMVAMADALTGRGQHWSLYLLARRQSYLGWHHLAEVNFGRIANEVVSEGYHMWLKVSWVWCRKRLQRSLLVMFVAIGRCAHHRRALLLAVCSLGPGVRRRG